MQTGEENNSDPLNAYELQAICNLFTWAAAEHGAAETKLRDITAEHFGVRDVRELQRKDYDEVIRFLVDLRRRHADLIRAQRNNEQDDGPMTPTDLRVLCTALGFTAVVMKSETTPRKEGARRAREFARLIEEFCRETVPEAFEANQQATQGTAHAESR
jgi:hypothetical protein